LIKRRILVGVAPKKGLRVSTESANSFAASYVLLICIARRLETTSQRLNGLASSANIELLTIPGPPASIFVPRKYIGAVEREAQAFPAIVSKKGDGQTVVRQNSKS
jgi:hypothetical protein